MPYRVYRAGLKALVSAYILVEKCDFGAGCREKAFFLVKKEAKKHGLSAIIGGPSGAQDTGGLRAPYLLGARPPDPLQVFSRLGMDVLK